MNKIAACVVFIILCLLTSISASRADSVDDTAHEIYLELLSPFCPGRALNDCPTEKASILRDQIKSDLVAGQTKDAIIEKVVSQYGDSVKSLPGFTGTNLLAWIIPALFVLTGALIIRKTLTKTSANVD